MGKNLYLLKIGGQNCNGPGYITFHYNCNGHRGAPSLLGWVKIRGRHLYPKKSNCPASPLSCSWTWILSSCEKAWEGEQGSKVSIYCNKVEPQAKLYHLDYPSEFWKIRTVSETLRHYCSDKLVCFALVSPPPQVKAKRYCLDSSTGILKNALHKSVKIKNLFPVRMNVSNLWGLGMTECLGIIMLFIVQRSWRDLYTLFSH